MKTKIAIAVVCALGMGAAYAQTVQRGDVTVSKADNATQTVAQASTAAPIQVAQAGGTATGAAAGGATAGVGIGTTVILVGAAVAAIAISTDSGTAAPQH